MPVRDQFGHTNLALVISGFEKTTSQTAFVQNDLARTPDVADCISRIYGDFQIRQACPEPIGFPDPSKRREGIAENASWGPSSNGALRLSVKDRPMLQPDDEFRSMCLITHCMRRVAWGVVPSPSFFALRHSLGEEKKPPGAPLGLYTWRHDRCRTGRYRALRLSRLPKHIGAHIPKGDASSLFARSQGRGASICQSVPGPCRGNRINVSEGARDLFDGQSALEITDVRCRFQADAGNRPIIVHPAAER